MNETPMTPHKVRFLALAACLALAGSVLLTARDRPTASRARTEAAAPAAVPQAPAVKAKPGASRNVPVSSGEPGGSVRLVRGWTAPPDWVQAAHPLQWNALRSSAVLGGNSWALIIGINQYTAPTRDNIGSYQDAVSLRSYLLGAGWRDDHILLIGNTDATRSHVVAGLRWLASKTDGNSQVVFHYSGHERPFHNNPDGDGESMDVALWLSDNTTLLDGDLGRLLDPVQASSMWLDFAVCRAGGFNDNGTIKAGRLVTYSSPESELSYEDPDVGHSVFGYYSIVEGLQRRDADANGDGSVTVQEAFNYAQPRVQQRTDDKQHPQIVDRYGKSFTLTPPAPPPPPPPPSEGSQHSGSSPKPAASATPCGLPVCPKPE